MVLRDLNNISVGKNKAGRVEVRKQEENYYPNEQHTKTINQKGNPIYNTIMTPDNRFTQDLLLVRIYEQIHSC